MTTTREELLACLAALSEAAPDLRLGQLVANLATLAQGAKVKAIWDAEDEGVASHGPAAGRILPGTTGAGPDDRCGKLKSRT